MKLFDAYIFDLDGTVFLGDALLPTAGETIAALRGAGSRHSLSLQQPDAHP